MKRLFLLFVALIVGYAFGASPVPPNFTSAGYLLANSTTDAYLYYMYFEAQNQTNNLDAPILIWLQGGPGCSSLIGAFYENGPYRVGQDKTLVPLVSTWNQQYALLYIDNPVGSGFSYANKPNASSTSEEEVASNLLTFLTAFFEEYPSLSKRPLYVTGESYGGKFVPTIATYLLANNWTVAGVAVGDGLVAPVDQILVQAEVAYNFGLVDNQQRHIVEGLANIAAQLVSEGQWTEAADSRNQMLQYIQNCSGIATLLDVRRDSDFNYTDLTNYLNDPSIQAAIGANGTWESCAQEPYQALYGDIMMSTANLFAELLERNIPVLIYEGQFDGQDGVVSSEEWLQRLDWSGQNEWNEAFRYVWEENNLAVGSVRQYKSLTQVIVRNAGHLVPHDQPLVSQLMIQHWMNHNFPLSGL